MSLCAMGEINLPPPWLNCNAYISILLVLHTKRDIYFVYCVLPHGISSVLVLTIPYKQTQVRFCVIQCTMEVSVAEGATYVRHSPRACET